MKSGWGSGSKCEGLGHEGPGVKESGQRDKMLNCGGPEARLTPLSVKGMKYFNLT